VGAKKMHYADCTAVFEKIQGGKILKLICYCTNDYTVFDWFECNPCGNRPIRMKRELKEFKNVYIAEVR